MKKILSVLACVLVFALDAAGGAAQAQISDINSAINKAGRERMLSQRMAKAYLQIALKVDPVRSKRILEDSVALFDRQLVELKNYAPTPEIRDTYLKLEKVWIQYKDALIGKVPATGEGKRIVDLSDEVLALAHQGTVQLEKHSGTTAGRLVNVSGRQRMLSQRLAKLYQIQVLGVTEGKIGSDFETARKEFVAALAELEAAPANTAQIKEALELVRMQWFFFENALNQRATGDKIKLATAVATTSERILDEMELAVGHYERIGRN